jgi:ubiquinone/menaquinone biosynthesis C-methylase UbiE
MYGSLPFAKLKSVITLLQILRDDFGMNKKEQNHKELILEQLSRRAIPYSQRIFQSNKSSIELVIKASGVTKDGSVLDIACGPGSLTFEFAKIAQRVVGIDITPAMIKKAKELHNQNGYSGIDQSNFYNTL